VAFFVFFAGAARAGVVAAYFCSGADWFWRLRLGWTRLILQIFLLALLFALELARYVGQTLRGWLRGSGGGAGDSGLGAGLLLETRRFWARLRCLCWLLALLNLDVVEVADGFVVDARHHVFEEDEGFFLELDERIFLAVAAETDAFL
jgi:hypothetical protein